MARVGAKNPVQMGKRCDGTTQVHADSMKIAEFLLKHDGTIEIPNMELARKLDMLKRRGGVFDYDKARFSRAKNHLMDSISADGKPCCGYRVHYRRSGPDGSTWSLHDPTGGLGAQREGAIGNLLGWLSRERQHQTENRRQGTAFETLADDVLANGDREGYKLLQRAVIDLDRDGTVLPETMALLQAWAGTS